MINRCGADVAKPFVLVSTCLLGPQQVGRQRTVLDVRVMSLVRGKQADRKYYRSHALVTLTSCAVDKLLTIL